MSLDLLIPEITVVEKVVRTIVVYAVLLVGLRVIGKRELGQLNPSDLLVLLLLANAVQNSIIGPDDSLGGGLIGAVVLLAANHLLAQATFHSERLRRMFEGTHDDLVRYGVPVRAGLRRNLISQEELAAEARHGGIDELSDVRTARLEVSGRISVLPDDDHDPVALLHRVLDRLSTVESRLAAVTTHQIPQVKRDE